MPETLPVRVDQTDATEAIGQFELLFSSAAFPGSQRRRQSVIIFFTDDSSPHLLVTWSLGTGSPSGTEQDARTRARSRLTELRRRAAERMRLLPPYEDPETDAGRYEESRALERLQADTESWRDED